MEALRQINEIAAQVKNGSGDDDGYSISQQGKAREFVIGSQEQYNR